MIVDRLLADPAAPPSARAREFALNDLLVGAIRDQLAFQRATFEMELPDERLPLAQAMMRVRADGQTRSPELIGWSVLFHRYVCVNLNLAFDTLAEALAVDSRTARRYQHHAVERLTDWLTASEWDARRVNSRVRLTAALPAQVELALIGRESLLATLDRLRREQRPPHLVITGARGVGKTALVQEYVRSLIMSDAVDHLIWIDQSASLAEIQQAVIERVVPEHAQISLREYLQQLHVVIVLDGVDSLLHSHEAEFPALLETLSAATVLMIAIGYTALPVPHAHVVVPELSEDATIGLVEAALSGSDDSASALQSFGAAIWQAVGGNPLLIRLTAASSQFVDTLTTSHADSLDRVYGHAFDSLDRAEQRVWLMAALCPPGDIGLAQLQALWPAEAPSAAVEMLIRRALLDRGSRERGTFQMVSAARRFVQARFVAESGVRAQIVDLLSALDWLPETPPELRLTLFYLLRQDWLALPDSWRLRALHRLAAADVLGHQRAEWRALLERERERAGTLDAPLQTAYAVCLRRAAEWPQAIDLLTDVIRQTGMSGQFLEQSRAMLELAVVYRYRGDYEQGRGLLTKAEKAARRFHDADLLQRARLELAQIEIDRGDGAAALRLLESAPESLRVLALKGEALFLEGEAERGAAIVEQALNAPDADHATLARLHAILGRGLETQARLDLARDRFALAVTLLEQADDPFALARARANLAAVLIQLNQLDGVGDLLRRAEAVQRALGDRTGLMATRHNLRLFHIRSSL